MEQREHFFPTTTNYNEYCEDSIFALELQKVAHILNLSELDIAQIFADYYKQQQYTDQQQVNMTPSPEIASISSINHIHLDSPPSQAFLSDLSHSNHFETKECYNNDEELRQCSKCHTSITPLWRRGINGCLLCNKCGLQLKRKLEKQKQQQVKYSNWSPPKSNATTTE